MNSLITDQIKEIFTKELAVESTLLTASARLHDDLGADSLALLNIAEKISAQFGIEIFLDDLIELESFSEVTRLVEAKLGT